jgi:hypothetical protein
VVDANEPGHGTSLASEAFARDCPRRGLSLKNVIRSATGSRGQSPSGDSPWTGLLKTLCGAPPVREDSPRSGDSPCVESAGPS